MTPLLLVPLGHVMQATHERPGWELPEDIYAWGPRPLEPADCP
jgi:hypothetical protein